MEQNQTIFESSKHSKAGLTSIIAAILAGIGLWILSGGINAIPPILTWISVLLVIVGGIRVILEGYKALKNNKNPVFQFLIPLILAVGIASVLSLAEHCYHYLAFPYPLDDGEGFCLNQAILLASGRQLYQAIGPAPYIVTNYPPVYPAILSIFTDPDNASFFAGRFISVISTIMLAVAAAGCVNGVTKNRTAGWIAGLMVLASPVIYFWGALLRVDILASALGIIALWIAISARGAGIFWSLPFLIAAIFTRQSSVEAAFAIAASLLLTRKQGQGTNGTSTTTGVVIVVGWIIGVVAILMLLQFLTGGEFWRHTVIYTRTQFYPERILTAAKWILPAHSIILLLAIFTLPGVFKDRKKRILGFYFIGSLATALLSGKVGSDLNYFINLIIASSCLAGIFAFDMMNAIGNLKVKPGWILAVLLLVPAGIFQSGLLEGNRGYSFTPQLEDNLTGQRIVETLSSVNGPILSEDEGFCILAGHEVLFNPFIMSEMAREGFWDETPFVNAIVNKEFDIIMLRFDVNDPYNDDQPGAGGHAGWDRFTPGMENAIIENYVIDKSVSQIQDAFIPLFMRRYWFFYRPDTNGQEPVDGRQDILNLLNEN
jgi:hypothetical protein